jgi:hypothetical protein
VIDPLPATQRGAVLAGVNAKPCGWLAASVDPRCGRHPLRTDPEPRSVNRRSPRFRGWPTDTCRKSLVGLSTAPRLGALIAHHRTARLEAGRPRAPARSSSIETSRLSTVSTHVRSRRTS